MQILRRNPPNICLNVSGARALSVFLVWRSRGGGVGSMSVALAETAPAPCWGSQWRG